MLITPPDLARPDREGFGFLPSWSGRDSFLNDEHRGIYAATRELPGWQDPADSEKLYELAYHCGGVILEIGVFGGRSAVVELRGALAAHADRAAPLPQFYGVDVDPGAFFRSRKTLEDAGLADRTLLYHGDLARFLRDITMVFVDGDHRYPGCWADLNLLADWLRPGTPVMCHDYGGIPGVRRAVDEWIAAGAYTRMGQFAGSMLLRAAGPQWRRGGTPAGCASRGLGLSAGAFEALRQTLNDHYTGAPGIRADAMFTPVHDLTADARAELRGPNWARVASGRARWPYALPADHRPLPPTMPGGEPWPRITVVTPSFNQGRYIEETILSVRNQDYPNLEHIIMDGGSTDSTMEVVARYRDGLAHVVHERDEGQSDAINKGFALATGDLLTWLNSDDMLAPGALGAMALAFKTSGADLVAGECRVFRDGELVARHLTSCADGPLPLENLLDLDGCWLEGQFFYQPEVMFTRQAWEKAGAHVRTDLYHSMDYELWCRMAAAGLRLHVIGRPVAHFRAHPEQKTATDVVGGFRAELPRARDAFLERAGRAGEARPARPKPVRHKLRVTLYNDLGYAYGAGIAHKRIAEAFAEIGYDVSAVAAATTEAHHAAPRTTLDETVRAIAQTRPDLVVIGNLHGADLQPAYLEAVASRFPTVFLLHDLWLLTGRCAYTGGCRQYLQGCDERCTCDPSHPRLAPQLVAPSWRAKRRILDETDVVVWANSEWARAQAQEALEAHPTLRSVPVATVRFGLELDVFRPLDKAACRDALGLPQDRFIIMSSASSLADPRKGLRHLADALAILNLPDTLVTCVGWFSESEEKPIPGMRAMGYLNDPRRLAMLYAAADVFVGPSLEEAFGQVYIEAAACGTPSIGYPVDGKPEAICHGVSGLLTASVDPASLAAAIEQLYLDPVRREAMGRWARLWVENEFSMAASAHQLYCVLRQQGFVARLGLLPRHELAVSPAAAPDPIPVPAGNPGWRPLSGFEHWETPGDKSVPRSRWALGPAARFEVYSRAGGWVSVLITCRCWHEGQRVRLVCAGKVYGEHSLDASKAGKKDTVLRFEVTLAPGANELEMQFWKWSPGPRPMAIFISNISVIGEGPGPEVQIPEARTVRLAAEQVERKPRHRAQPQET
jgi:glycosyltransferase involved in cell wall biosynthesis